MTDTIESKPTFKITAQMLAIQAYPLSTLLFPDFFSKSTVYLRGPVQCTALFLNQNATTSRVLHRPKLWRMGLDAWAGGLEQRCIYSLHRRGLNPSAKRFLEQGDLCCMIVGNSITLPASIGDRVAQGPQAFKGLKAFRPYGGASAGKRYLDQDSPFLQ